jgi:hypothetical protein
VGGGGGGGAVPEDDEDEDVVCPDVELPEEDDEEDALDPGAPELAKPASIGDGISSSKVHAPRLATRTASMSAEPRAAG